MATKDSFDLRAEEDAARRLNVGRILPPAAGPNARGKHSELIGKPFLRQRLDVAARKHGIRFHDDAALYLAAAVESSLRALAALARSAQLHRTTSSHLHVPPLLATDTRPRPIWSHALADDPNAVLDALNRRHRDAEQEFRKQRMDRLARDAETHRARDRQQQRDRENAPEEPDHPSASPSPVHTAAPATPAKPVFGAVKETSLSSKKKSSKKSARDVSAEVQHKMTNLTAMRSVGMNKKYGWMMGNQPAVSSPLAGKKRKAETDGQDGGRQSPLVQSSAASAASTIDRPAKKPRPIPVPTRRIVSISTPPSPHPPYTATDKDAQKATDDKALTLVDLVFALEHGGLGPAGGHGMGSVTGDVLQRLWARGGPYSEADGKK